MASVNIKLFRTLPIEGGPSFVLGDLRGAPHMIIVLQIHSMLTLPYCDPTPSKPVLSCNIFKRLVVYGKHLQSPECRF